MVGTFGYMAPEQFAGQAIPQSDLYGLGITLIELLSGRTPAELPQDDMRLRFEAYLYCRPELKHWLAQLVAPDPGQRCPSAKAAQMALDDLGKNHQSQGSAQSASKHSAQISQAESKSKPTHLMLILSVGVFTILLIPLLIAVIYNYAPGDSDSAHKAPETGQSKDLETLDELMQGFMPSENCLTLNSPLPAQTGAEAEAFRSRFNKAFPLPAGDHALEVPNITRLEELNALWRCKASRSESDPIYFKAAWKLIQHSPLDDNTVVSAINLIATASPNYPQRTALLKFAYERYFAHQATDSYDRPAHTIAGITIDLAQQLNLHNRYPETISKLDALLQQRSSEINDHQLQLLNHEFAYALWKTGQKSQALNRLDQALKAYPEGSHQEQLKSLQTIINAS